MVVTGDPAAAFISAVEAFRAARDWSMQRMSLALGLTRVHWQIVRDRRQGIGRAVLLGAAKIPELKPAVDAYLAAAPMVHPRRRKKESEG